MTIFAIYDILLSVQEPTRDFVLEWILHDGNNSLKLVRVQVTSTVKIDVSSWLEEINLGLPFLEVDVSLLAYEVGISATNTLDFGQSVHNFPLTVDIGVEETQNVLRIPEMNELRCLIS